MGEIERRSVRLSKRYPARERQRGHHQTTTYQMRYIKKREISFHRKRGKREIQKEIERERERFSEREIVRERKRRFRERERER